MVIDEKRLLRFFAKPYQADLQALPETLETLIERELYAEAARDSEVYAEIERIMVGLGAQMDPDTAYEATVLRAALTYDQRYGVLPPAAGEAADKQAFVENWIVEHKDRPHVPAQVKVRYAWVQETGDEATKEAVLALADPVEMTTEEFNKNPPPFRPNNKIVGGRPGQAGGPLRFRTTTWTREESLAGLINEQAAAAVFQMEVGDKGIFSHPTGGEWVVVLLDKEAAIPSTEEQRRELASRAYYPPEVRPFKGPTLLDLLRTRYPVTVDQQRVSALTVENRRSVESEQSSAQ